MKDKKFSYVDSQGFEHEVELTEKDFELVQENKVITDQKIQTKPTTFFKDAMRRFSKNKSSVAGGIILGVLVALAIVLPLALPSDVDHVHPSENLLAPKLFDAGAGWWDGGYDYNNVTIDVDWDEYERSGTLVGKPTDHPIDLVIGGQNGMRYNGIGYTDAVNAYANGGYARLNGNYAETAENPKLLTWNGVDFDFTDDSNDYTIKIDSLDPSQGDIASYWKYGATVKFDVNLEWQGADQQTPHAVKLAEDVTPGSVLTLKLNDSYADIIAEINTDPYAAYMPQPYALSAGINKPQFSFELKHEAKGTEVNNVAFKSIVFSSANAEEAEALAKYSMVNANKTLSLPPKDSGGVENPYHWSTLNGSVNLFHASLVQGSYRIDTYEQKLGITQDTIAVSDMKVWVERGWMSANIDLIADPSIYQTDEEFEKATQDFLASVRIIDSFYCPLVIDEDHPFTCKGEFAHEYSSITPVGYFYRWKQLYPGTNSMPRYIFGTDDSGKDMFKYVFAGLRTSLLLGVVTFLVNFTFGLVYGAFAGYFGGWTDILMERFTDILGGVPWIVVMTLMIILFGHTFTVFAIALCITGWIGTASLTRTQFYRFKSREYILAARTLGASDGRLIFRHILPNAVGTIVTSSVLMIPGVIFSEATLAYLQLGLQGMSSFGVILAENQRQINTQPHLILFPSIVMALMMISFNLFGNGLRDAFNPSLKGGE